ncbi:U3 small nucleolar RNA-associated protein 6 like protein [Astathelohania contejeani]|uniref:U3 small nucleolar RNA-associated protein 6 like protein n=1 Tax=Astathelohania contejeani TaxID=164912 RepID=A0ABQ7HY99_9MICR|nr:U3 small nucleolar RNA-associated protein 6 like protein [Thelohania contejeani]
MSQIIQYNLEKMIPELEDYKTRGIFDAGEIKEIVNSRRNHEYRIHRPAKLKIDYLRYIQYELTLQRIKEKRIKKRGLPTSKKDYVLTRRIIGLYRKAIKLFSDDLRIFVECVEYCMHKKRYGEMKYLLSEYCTWHAGDADVWVYAGGKHYEINDIEGARIVFQRGIRMNPQNMKLRLEFLRMEILICKKMDNSEEKKIAEAILSDSMKINDTCDEIKEMKTLINELNG